MSNEVICISAAPSIMEFIADHWLPAHVEQSVPLERNINSDLHTLATSNRERLERRGERNVPKRYLKNTEWAKNFQALQWGLTYEEDDHFILQRPAPVKCRLHIFDEERTPD